MNAYKYNNRVWWGGKLIIYKNPVFLYREQRNNVRNKFRTYIKKIIVGSKKKISCRGMPSFHKYYSYYFNLKKKKKRKEMEN